MLHIHVLLVAPLGSSHMAQPGTDQHEGRVTVREGPHHTGASADLPVQPLNHIVGADPGPVLIGEILSYYNVTPVGYLLSRIMSDTNRIAGIIA